MKKVEKSDRVTGRFDARQVDRLTDRVVLASADLLQ
jgi:hypothetical protein